MKEMIAVFIVQMLLIGQAFGGLKAATVPPHQILEFDLHDSKVDFLSVGRPAAIKIRGEGSKLEGALRVEDNLATGKLTFDLESLDTSIALRDKHMKEKYLETNKYKTAELTIEKLKIPEQIFSNDMTSVSVPFEGVLSLHGVKHPIKGISKVQMKNNAISGKADFEIHLSDYNIEIPTYLGVTVADNVQVSVDFLAQGKETKK